METKDRVTLAELLRKAASQSIAEGQFWSEMQRMTERVDEPIVKLAAGSATGYWQLFQPKKKFLLLSMKPDPAEVRQARDELNLIAAVLETGWQLPELPDIEADQRSA